MAWADESAQEHQHKPNDLALDEVITIGAPTGRTRLDLLTTTDVVKDSELERSLAPTLGETLARQPGISSTYFGNGASRPVIRGLGGSRVRTLVDGIGSLDAAVTSPDHAVAIDPLTAKSFEIIRGPAALLYGNSASGGVINVRDGRIPEEPSDKLITGKVRVAVGSVADEASLSGTMDVSFGDFILHSDGFYRQTDNFDIPGFARSEIIRALSASASPPPLPAQEIKDEVLNSDVESKGLTIGASRLFDAGFVGMSVSRSNNDYGLPISFIEDPAAINAPESVRIEVDQTRYDFKAHLETPIAFLDTTRLRFGYVDYEHREIEDGAIGTIFKNDGWEGRIELKQRAFANLKGLSGFQATHRDFEAIGDEAFVPPSKTQTYGIFSHQEITFNKWRAEGGLRYEWQEIQSTSVSFNKETRSLSGSVGLAYRPDDYSIVGINVFRTERAPIAEELLSNGAHLATDTFEIGSQSLKKETGLGIEIVARSETDIMALSGSLFYTDYSDFIFESATGSMMDGLPVFQFSQSDAAFYGWEAEADIELVDQGGFAINLHLTGDYVRAKRDGTVSENLPRIPPLSLTAGLELRSEYIEANLETEWVAKQKHEAIFESETNGYTLLNASLSYRLFGDNSKTVINLTGRNLTDKEARNHVSFLKERLPLPGRDVRVSVTQQF